MADKYLYNLVIPEGAQLTQTQRQVRQLLSQGTLSPGTAAVESITADAGTKTLTGRVTGEYAELTAAEFEELFSQDDIEVVAFYAPGTDATHEDRYVALKDVSTEPAHPFETRVQRFDGSLTKVGTRASHRRALRANPTTESNPFGSDTTAEVGIPARASKVQWYDPNDASLTDATVQRTVTGEHDDIAIYDAAAPSISRPVLVYDVAYRHEWPVDVRVWDDRNGQKLAEEGGGDGATVGSDTVGSATVGNSPTTAVRWQRVFSADHDYQGTPIVETDRLRVEFDAPQKLRAYRWDAGEEDYARVQLGATAWRLTDANIRRIGVERIDGQCKFSSGSSSHNLNVSLKRGYEDALWLNPDNEGSVPQGLIDRLDPIAATSDEDPAAVADVIERNEVDR